MNCVRCKKPITTATAQMFGGMGADCYSQSQKAVSEANKPRLYATQDNTRRYSVKGVRVVVSLFGGEKWAECNECEEELCEHVQAVAIVDNRDFPRTELDKVRAEYLAGEQRDFEAIFTEH